MFDFIIYLCSLGETKDVTAWCLFNLWRRTEYRFDIRWHTGDALISRARSTACSKFLKGNESPYLIFIDTDIQFEPSDIEKIYKAMQAGYDIIAGAYGMSGGKELAIWVDKPMKWDGHIAEARYISTGFMGISRRALEQIRDKLDLPLLHEGMWCECYPFMEAYAVPEEKIYISEDWDFCNKARKAGLKAYLHTGVLVGHIKHTLIPAQEALKNMIERDRGKEPKIAEEFVVQSTLPQDLAEFLGISEQETNKRMASDPAKVMADEWNVWEGSIEDFYKQNKSYIYDLANFNYRPTYWADRVAPIMKEKNKAILDIGCGIGSVALYLARHRNKVVGYDVNPYLIDFCNFRKGKFGLTNVEFTTEMPDVSQFDLILAIDTLEHIEDLHSYLLELGRDMKSGAKLYHFDDFLSSKEIYPMHFDHSEHINEWLKESGFLIWNERWAIKQ